MGLRFPSIVFKRQYQMLFISARKEEGMWIELEQRILKLNTRKNVTHFNMRYRGVLVCFVLF